MARVSDMVVPRSSDMPRKLPATDLAVPSALSAALCIMSAPHCTTPASVSDRIPPASSGSGSRPMTMPSTR